MIITTDHPLAQYVKCYDAIGNLVGFIYELDTSTLKAKLRFHRDDESGALVESEMTVVRAELCIPVKSAIGDSIMTRFESAEAEFLDCYISPNPASLLPKPFRSTGMSKALLEEMERKKK